MKTTTFIWAAVLTLLVAGCSSDIPSDNVKDLTPVPSKVKKTITATIQGSSTKTALGQADGSGNYTPVWSEGDQIGVFFNGVGGGAVPFTLVSGAGTTMGVFEGEDGGDSYQAFYPYEMIDVSINDDRFYIDLPDNQVYTSGSFAPDAYPMLSSLATDNQSLQFTNLMAVAQVSLTGSETITSVSLSSNNSGVSLSTAAEVSLSEKNLFCYGSNSVRMTLPSGGLTLSDEPTDFFFVIPAQTYRDGFTLEVSNGEETACTSFSGDIEFKGSELRMVCADVDFVHGIYIPDAALRSYIKEHFDTNDDGVLTQEEVDSVTEIVMCSDEVKSAEGIEYFTNLQRLDLYGTRDPETGVALGQISSIDLSQNTALSTLNLSNNALGSVDLSQNTALTILNLSNCALTSLDLINNTALVNLDCSENLLGSLPLSKNTALTILNCSKNRLSTLNLKKNTALTNLNCSNNLLNNLVLSENTALTAISCQRNQLTSLDLSKNTNLWVLDCDNNLLTALDLSLNTSLATLYCHNNLLTALDVSQNANLSSLNCMNNSIGELWLSISQSIDNLLKDDATLIRYIEPGQMQQITTGSPVE